MIHNIGEITNTHHIFRQWRNYRRRLRFRTPLLYLINENGGRAIVPFDGMLCTDAFIWTRFRGDTELMGKLVSVTDTTCSGMAGCKGSIGDGSTIKNVRCIRDAIIGSSAIIDGTDLIENCTIRSDDLEPSKTGPGVQLNSALVGYGNVIDSGAQFRSVITGNCVSASQTARISHSFIGDNSAIACCEIANSLLSPSHAQHHNNSFLIAAFIGGQSNIAAGSTIGSNHNSRINDGEIWASRGFWPGLCTSFKHNSSFASFTMCAKADFPS